ncbi:MerR family transcriptional regulator [Fructilactobacillus fructivorans]|uniref:Helix-turn-helix domain-containing protein n=1 Tax=Fructilactobacillus fructivorans TaxID=1614 RepID=A0AAE6P194_9LACO|nr:helix-turn-helix domain-containing protein [Fructilactobacillus fructivorans]KRK58484.1 hypothetical protein FC73_GL000035 [Fructilactobacillus fructivorans]KRN13326.1 hypothetical protein IV37_GL000038 [Fructilactobacillus fructivorans]KRN40034.1 hypothetical protein IV51_GL000212 [Fructilactobacillus fructivorans]QFX92493.1 hypothetical protein LF543_02510 [Fructilactobacillus fructivorans]RDV65911.1 DNA-binding protein [Fructilactobacillus fructivorans]
MIEDTINKAILHVANSVEENTKNKQAIFDQRELAKYLDTNTNTLKKYYIYEPDFPVIKQGDKLVYPRKKVDEWIDDHTQTYEDIM